VWATPTSCTSTDVTGNGYETVTVKSTAGTQACVTTWTTPARLTSTNILIVAGGGGGGFDASGGGGGGGVYTSSSYSVTPGASNNIVIGGGGPAAASAYLPGTGTGYSGKNGGDTYFGSRSTSGGGGGGGKYSGGYNGGSGGGAGLSSSAAGGTAVSGQGNIGGTNVSNYGYGAGGGGAGSAGGAAASGAPGNGGAGLSYFGTYWAAGGGGGNYQNSTQGVGGSSIGGNGGTYTTDSTPGAANTGSGGGAGGHGAFHPNPSAGSSGIVMLVFPIPTILLAFTAPGNPLSLIFRTATTLSISTNVPGKVTFSFNGKAIPNCRNISAATSASCSWKPSAMGIGQVSALLTSSINPSNTATQVLAINASRRTTTR